MPLLSRPFTQTSSWCLRLKHNGHRTFCTPWRDCEAETQIHKLSCGGTRTLFIINSDFTADLGFRMRKLWRDIANMNPQESNSKLVSYYSWFACPLQDLQDD